MRLYNNIIKLAALALGLALAGCSVLPEESLSGEGREIKFTASVGTFQVKATDNAFERGDAIGLFADSPVSANNVRMTWDGSYLVPETKVFWAPGDQKEIGFSAYYPYSSEMSNGWIVSYVNADQTTHELFTQSDFMTARSAASSRDGVVNFIFEHCFSKIVLHVENALQDIEIADVYIGNVYGRVQTDAWGGYSVTGLPGTIKAGKAVTPDGENVWAVIIPPQWCRPQLMITTTDGKQFTYQPEWEISFESRCRYNAYVTIDGGAIFTDFTSEVTEWTDNNDLAFPQPGEANWSIVGIGEGNELPMPNCYSGRDAYYGLVYYEEGEALHFLRNGSGSYGIESSSNAMYGTTLVAGGEGIVLPHEGVFEIILYPMDNYVYISEVGSLNSWGITGTFENLNWSRDHYANFTTYTDVGGLKLPVLGYSIKYREGNMFKFRFNGEWFMEYGYPELWGGDYYSVTVPTDEEIDLMYQGSNFSLPEDGLYDIYFDLYNRKMKAVKTGDIPPVAPSPIVIDGDFSDWDKVDPNVLSIAYSAENPSRPALKMMKAFADENALFVYFEYDPDMIYYERDVEYVPFHIAINSDNNNYTGGWLWSSWWAEPGIDYLLESFLYYDGYLNYSDAGVYRWNGGDCEDNWSFDWENVPYGYSTGAGNGYAYEVRLEREALPLGDNFAIGIDIEQSWDAVGVLPNVNDDGSSRTTLLPVNVGGPGVVMGAPRVECNSVAEAVYLDDNTNVNIHNALVYAKSTRGFVIWDGPDSGAPALVVYHGYWPDCPVVEGDMVNVSGTKITYRGVPEISNVDLTFSVVSSGNRRPQIYYQDLTAQLDNYPSYSVPGSFKGVLSVDGTHFDVACEGSSNQGNLYWPSVDLTPLVGATIRATGFTFYSHEGYSSLVSDYVRVLDLPVESTITDVINGNDADYYKVSGTVTRISNTKYGNYYIQDDNGNELYIYGTVSEWGYYPLDGVNWDGVTLEAAGVTVGAKVTVVGVKKTYKEVPELVDVILVEAVPAN